MNTAKKLGFSGVAVVLSVSATLLLSVQNVTAAPLVFQDKPLFVTNPVPPMAMIDFTKDHQLYYKAYNDYSDLDGDDAYETTYKHSFDYYGYFDPKKCYTYSTANKQFEPHSVTTDKYCSGQWSGNFLNWVSMSRMDVIRKVLYGGSRSTDTSTDTVLERSYLPTDAHSWAKYYNGNDIDKLTPFTVATTAPTGTSATSMTVPVIGTDFTFTTALVAQIGDQVHLVSAANSANFMYGVVTAIGVGSLTIRVEGNVPTARGGAGGTYSDWNVTNLSATGISFCNTTYESDTAKFSHNTTKPPLIRVVQGNFALWSANERWQCYWREEKNNTQSGFSGGMRSNGNRVYASGLASSAENPSYAAHGLTHTATEKADYVARVQACVATLLGSETCTQYPDGNYKPVGLLQRYGETDSPKIRFGLLTGSYYNNVSGGVLRKGISASMDDEINTATNGTFKFPQYKSGLGNPVDNAVGIIRSVDRLRLYGYGYNNGTYDTGAGVNDDNCTYQQIGIVPRGTPGAATAGGKPAEEGKCSTWGNPLSEMYLESLRYLAGQTDPTAAYNYTAAGTHDDELGLPRPVTWTDPLNGSNWCSPLNTLIVSSTVSSFDGDQLGGFSDLNSGSLTLGQFTKLIGDDEGIAGNSALVGRSGATYTGTCSAKAVGDLAEVSGLCPEAPSLEGTYHVAGLANYAKTNRIRINAGGYTPDSSDTKAFKVTTYGIQLATNTPRITVPVGTGSVTIQPAYRLDRTDVAADRYGTGTIVDFKIVQQTASSGLFYINWEDSNQGGDYDQDLWGTISYTVAGDQISVTTTVASASSANPQGFGFIISGTDKDGPHFYSGIYNFNYADPTPITVTATDAGTKINASGGCNACSDQTDRTPRTATFNLGTGTALALEDPLYYASKWGGFNDSDTSSSDPGFNKPDKQAEWDSKKTDGSPGSDDQPDTYFYVNNPGNLEKALNTAFVAIVSSSAASAVATNSSSLQTGTKIYQARFNPLNWTGELVSFTIDPETLELTENWNAASCMKNAKVPASGTCTSSATASADRVIFTYKPSTKEGVLFKTLSDLDATQQAALKSGTEDDTETQKRLNYLRGDETNSGLSVGQFRQRPVTVLGDIVTSSPFYVGEPRGQYENDYLYFQAYSSTTNTHNYFTFRNARLSRAPMLYVGGNDGMLHAFDASTGIERFAFIPNAMMGTLKELSNQSYQHKFFVDGSPVIADAEFSTGWKTVLVGGYNQGGRGIYALDVTDPESVSAASVSGVPLWEFTSDTDSDMGYSFPTPHIAKMKNGKWAIIMANGYNSGSENAALFIIDIEAAKSDISTAYVKIDTCSAFVGACGSNGLSSPTAMDYDGDGMVDFIYAGDLKGNLWKFDVSSSSTADWSVATLQTQGSAVTAKQPLFVACTDTSEPCPLAKRQAITAKPAVSSASDLLSVMVYFGTGRYLESSDSGTTQQQTMYGVLEKITMSEAGVITSAETATRAKLKQSVLENKTTCTDGENDYACDVRTATAADVDYENGDKGWYQDLLNTGERIVAPIHFINGFVFYNTFIPSTSPCEFGGTGYLMAILGETGGQSDQPVFDTDNNGVIDKLDMPSGGIRVGAVLGGSTVIKPGGAGIGVAISNPTKPTAGDPEPVRDPVSGRVFLGNRISWRQLINE